MLTTCKYSSKMFRMFKEIHQMDRKGFKNFGHKRQPESTFTVLWHGFLTFTFIGMGIEWKRVIKFIFGEEPEQSGPLDLE